MKAVADRIKALRRALGVTQEALGKLAGVTKSAVSQWERGICKPERDALLALKRARNINPEWIAGEREPMILDERFEAREPGARYGVKAELPVDTRTIADQDLRAKADKLIRALASGRVSKERFEMALKLLLDKK